MNTGINSPSVFFLLLAGYFNWFHIETLSLRALKGLFLIVVLLVIAETVRNDTGIFSTKDHIHFSNILQEPYLLNLRNKTAYVLFCNTCTV